MAVSICLMSDGTIPTQAFSARLAQCGFAVWQCHSASDYVFNPRRADTVCLIVAMDAQAALSRMELLRLECVGTPAILIVRNKAEILPSRLVSVRVLDILQAPVNLHELLTWLECICIALEYGRKIHVVAEESERIVSWPAVRRAIG